MNLYAKFISAFGGRIINMFRIKREKEERERGNTELKEKGETGKKIIRKNGKNKWM